MIANFLLLLLLSGTLFQMMSCVAHNCHQLSLVQFTKTELSLGSLYICELFGLVIALVMAFLKNALMCIKKSKIN